LDLTTRKDIVYEVVLQSENTETVLSRTILISKSDLSIFKEAKIFKEDFEISYIQ